MLIVAVAVVVVVVEHRSNVAGGRSERSDVR